MAHQPFHAQPSLSVCLATGELAADGTDGRTKDSFIDPAHHYCVFPCCLYGELKVFIMFLMFYVQVIDV